jgi:HSP20 family molecular chaperone IbpA
MLRLQEEAAQMSGSQRKFNPFDSNWKDFEKNFMRGYRDAFNYDLSWLDGYIQNMISQAIPSSQHFSGFTQNRLRPDVFETHQDMIVRVRIPERANTRKLGVAFNNANKVRISGLGDRDETISLPAAGRYDGSKAFFKDGILEIRIPKELNEAYQDIYIQYM